MLQGTTPAYELRIGEYDLTDKTVFVTITSGCKSVTKTGEDLDVEFDGQASIVRFRLTQAETLMFEVGNAQIQVRFVGANGLAYGTETVKVKVRGSLLKKVIRYEGDTHD